MSREVALTTIDNPFDPFEQFEQWFNWDVSKGYNTCAYLDRVSYTSEALPESENRIEMRDGLGGGFSVAKILCYYYNAPSERVRGYYFQKSRRADSPTGIFPTITALPPPLAHARVARHEPRAERRSRLFFCPECQVIPYNTR